MPDQSPVLGLPYILPAQAQKHITHNTALRQLDLLVQLAVQSRASGTPPAIPTTGERHIVGAGGSGDWTGQENSLALWSGSAWEFTPPKNGWQAYVQDENTTLVFDGATWGGVTLDLQNLGGVGINTTSDSTNKLSISADATLISHAGSGHQLKINKAASSDTAAILLQDNWSGRAEIGLSGDDDLHIKVSPDGSNWYEAITLDQATGVASFPGSPHLSAPNLIRNPSFYCAQRGNGPFSLAGYTVDGFKISTGGQTPAITREILPPAEAETAQGEYYLRYDNTGQTGLYQSIKIPVEDVMITAGSDLVLSFDARCNIAQPLARIYSYQEFGSGGSTHAYMPWVDNLPITTSWTRFSVGAALASVAGKTLGTGHYLNITVSLSLNNASFEGMFDIRRIKLEKGSKATPFQPSSPAQDMAQSRYYFQRWHNAQNLNDLAYGMRVTPTGSGAGPYDYSAEL
jgi:hypothetical protein